MNKQSGETAADHPRVVQSVQGMGFQYRARVFESKTALLGRRCWRYQIERHFIGWRDYGDPSWSFATKPEAEAGANKRLDELSAKPDGEYV